VVILLTRGFIGPAIFADHWGCRGHDGWAVLVGHRGCEALTHEGPPLVFLVGDEFVAPKANGFTEGGVTARQTFIVRSSGGHR
jgi:hypothetical protein